MANETTTKTFLDLAGLTSYDTKIKNYINTADLLSIKYAATSQDGNNLLLYKVASPTVGTTEPDFTIPMGSAALKTLVTSLGTAVGAVPDSAQDPSSYSAPTFTGDIASATSIANACQILDNHIGTLASLTTTTKTSIVAAINEIVSAIAALDVSEFALATVSNNVVTIKGIKEVDGKIAVGTDTTKDVTLEEVAITGAAADVSYDNTTSELTATDVQAAIDEVQSNIETLDESLADVAKSGNASDVAYDNTDSGLTATDAQAAIDELAAASSGGVASKTVYITETTGSTGDVFSKRYGVYQGATGSSSSPVVGEKLVDIDIPKDMVVESGSVVDITYDSAEGKLYDGLTDVTELIKGAGGTALASDAGKYIKLIIANAASNVLYIAAKDLVDIYTAEQNATQIQLVIDNNNVISATIVAGSVDTTELADGAVTTAKIADDAVTADKVAISAHTESQTAGTDGVAVSVTTTDGQVSAVSASIAANTYEPYGAAAAAIEKLDVSAIPFATYTAGTSGTADTIVINGGIKEVDGEIADGEGDTITLSTITSTQIDNLFS